MAKVKSKLPANTRIVKGRIVIPKRSATFPRLDGIKSPPREEKTIKKELTWADQPGKDEVPQAIIIGKTLESVKPIKATSRRVKS